MVLLMNAPSTFPLDQEFICVSRNSSTVTTSRTKFRLAHDVNVYCKWVTLVLNCSTVTDPEAFLLGSFGIPDEVKIEFDFPEKKEIPVVACLSPMFLEERWQALVVFVELHSHFGVDLQVHYVHSGMTQIIELLKNYEKKNILKIREFPFLKLNQEYLDLLGHNPLDELDGRNQAVSYTDCLMKYREAAEFILAIDIDDIMIPYITSNYLSELRFFADQYPTASAFVFPRYRAEISTATSFREFSLDSTLRSLRIFGEIEIGKSVLFPGKSETAWIHWPGLGNESSVEMPKEKSLFLHLKNWNYFEIQPSESAKCESTNCHNLQIDEMIEDFSTFSSNFYEKIDIQKFENLTIFGIYSSAVEKCYSNFRFWVQQHNVSMPCLTRLKCPVPKKVKGFSCSKIDQIRKSATLGSSLILHLPKGTPFWVHEENGCRI